MTEKNEIQKDEVTKQAPIDPMKSDSELSDAALEKAAGGYKLS